MRPFARAFQVALLAVAISACPEHRDACSAGITRTCSCVSAHGVAACLADGTWGPCLCASTPTATQSPHSSPALPPPPPLLPPPPRDELLGDWDCQFTLHRTAYPPFHCVISQSADGTLRFEKTSGSQRFRGALTRTADGFTLAGTFYCPQGACTQPATARFHRTDAGYLGTLLENRVRLERHIATPAPTAPRPRPQVLLI